MGSEAAYPSHLQYNCHPTARGSQVYYHFVCCVSVCVFFVKMCLSVLEAPVWFIPSWVIFNPGATGVGLPEGMLLLLLLCERSQSDAEPCEPAPSERQALLWIVSHTNRLDRQNRGSYLISKEGTEGNQGKNPTCM